MASRHHLPHPGLVCVQIQSDYLTREEAPKFKKIKRIEKKPKTRKKVTDERDIVAELEAQAAQQPEEDHGSRQQSRKVPCASHHFACLSL